MSASSTIGWSLVFILAYLEAPTILVWGWIRWSSLHSKQWTISSTLSLIGFALASASAFLGLWTIGYASAGGFELKYDFFFRIVAKGFILSLAAMLFARRHLAKILTAMVRSIEFARCVCLLVGRHNLALKYSL
ncbi:MAG: hypothetical protein WCA10_01920 [Terracidiphilus sp.]